MRNHVFTGLPEPGSRYDAGRRILVVVCLLFVHMIAARWAWAQGFTDDFEASTLDSFWVAYQQYGSVELSIEQSWSGSQSVKLTSADGGQRNIWIGHGFPQAVKGTVSVWFYDDSPGTGTLYSGLYASNSTQPSNDFAVNVADWESDYYIWHGPGVSETQTSVRRTRGWHEFKLQVTAAGFEAFIDQTLVGSVSGDFTFDAVYLVLSGPHYRPNATFYFDDFRFTSGRFTKDECKDGGWQHLTRADGSPFRNQGACVSYVNTGR